jgi:hypothetical protein
LENKIARPKNSRSMNAVLVSPSASNFLIKERYNMAKAIPASSMIKATIINWEIFTLLPAKAEIASCMGTSNIIIKAVSIFMGIGVF